MHIFKRADGRHNTLPQSLFNRNVTKWRFASIPVYMPTGSLLKAKLKAGAGL